MSIYTRTGDNAQTSLPTGKRINKDSLFICAVGAIDELGANIECAILYVSNKCDLPADLERINRTLFFVGGHLLQNGDDQTSKFIASEIDFLEKRIDDLSIIAPELKTFVSIGRSASSAHLNIARTVCRRAEREVAALFHKEYANPLCLSYINRLSDYLFAACRADNALNGVEEPELVIKT